MIEEDHMCKFSLLRVSPGVSSGINYHSCTTVHIKENLQCVLMCTSGVPLTPSNVMRIVREVEKWWSENETESLTTWLFIPVSKQEEIRCNYLDKVEQKRQAISYWINTDPLASWRRLITALDWSDEGQLADSIRHNAEPLPGKYEFHITHILHIDHVNLSYFV